MRTALLLAYHFSHIQKYLKKTHKKVQKIHRNSWSEESKKEITNKKTILKQSHNVNHNLQPVKPHLEVLVHETGVSALGLGVIGKEGKKEFKVLHLATILELIDL